VGVVRDSPKFSGQRYMIAQLSCLSSCASKVHILSSDDILSLGQQIIAKQQFVAVAGDKWSPMWRSHTAPACQTLYSSLKNPFTALGHSLQKRLTKTDLQEFSYPAWLRWLWVLPVPHLSISSIIGFPQFPGSRWPMPHAVTPSCLVSLHCATGRSPRSA